MTENYIPSAFPVLEQGGNGLELTDTGMTLRDYFAGKVLPAMYSQHLSYFYAGNPPEAGWFKDVAESAYALADAMLAKRGSAK